MVNAIIARMDNGALASVGSTGAVHGGSGKRDIQVYSNHGWVDLDYIAGTGVIHQADGSTETLGPAPGEAGLSQSGYPDYPSRPRRTILLRSSSVSLLIALRVNMDGAQWNFLKPPAFRRPGEDRLSA